MKRYFCILLLFTSFIGSAQIRGNATNSSEKDEMIFSDFGNAQIYGNAIQNFRREELIPNPVISLDVKALNNVLADSYTAVFNVIQIGETTEETNNLMKERVSKVKTGLLSRGISEKDFVIDVISFIPVYETVIEKKLFSKKYNEVPKGFELQQNIHVKFMNVNQFEGILSTCADNEIYNLVKVDYFIEDIQAVYKNLRIEILKILKEKQLFYNDLGFDLKLYTPTIADTKYCYFPREFYKKYQAFHSTSLEALKKNRGVTTVKKQTSYYYDPVSFKDYDVVMNPSIVEPVIQIGMEIKVQYSPKPKELEAVEKEIIKNKYFIVSNDGAINVKELNLEN